MSRRRPPVRIPKGPVADPACPKRLWHFTGQRCEACGGIG